MSDLLETEIRVKCTDYQNIVLIAHSMGGLICKHYILNEIKENRELKVKSFISLAVPHQGAQLANIGSIALKNMQLVNLSVLSNLTDQMTREWLQYSSSIPKTTYFIGKEDRVVTENSAKAIDFQSGSINFTNDDHSSIICPAGDSSLMLEIKNKLTKTSKKESATIKDSELKLTVDFNFDTHYFDIIDTHANVQLFCEEILYKKDRKSEYDIIICISQEQEYRDKISKLLTLEDSHENKKIILDTKRYLDFFDDLKIILQFKINLLFDLSSASLFRYDKLEVYSDILMKIISDHQLNYSGIGAFPNLERLNKLKLECYIPLRVDDAEIDFVFPIYLDDIEFDDIVQRNGDGLDRNVFFNSLRYRKAYNLYDFFPPPFINQKVIHVLTHYAYDFYKKHNDVFDNNSNWKSLHNYYVGLG
ncbi:lipase family alpha/beta hydrolase [Flavobacterium sp. 3HN19-14]|uniref:esterase/lipase family protein n=1 Tax=Flavobacterium sp. 3HN19-14 TaxID=3448133 RepID=UPI003EE33D94